MKRQKNSSVKKKNEESSELSARLAALEILYNVLDRHTPLDQALDSSDSYCALDTRDKGFCRMLLSTTLRRLGQINDLIIFAQDRPDAMKSPKIQHILQIGVTQIFFMDVPDHAAVDTTVQLCDYLDAEKQKGFVNAVLRNLIRKGKEKLAAQDEGRLNTPEWLYHHWENDYGVQTAREIAAAHLHEAPLDITLKTGENPSYWAEALQSEVLPTGSLRRTSGGNIKELEGFDSGNWWIQDASAALPTKIFGDIKGKTVVDLCAAPGGKTLQLAASGANVIALDRSAARLKKLEENLIRMQFKDKVDVIVADAQQWNPPQKFSHILLDAPCSATGTIRRHPDTGYLKSPGDIKRLTDIQSRLLSHACDLLAPEGILIYCTCSLQKDEGEYQINALLQTRQDIKRLPVTATDTGGLPETITSEGDVRILPTYLKEAGGMDGFFISRLIKS